MMSLSDELLTREQIDQYHEAGFLVLPRFIPDELISAVNDEVEELTTGGGSKYPNVTVDVLQGPYVGQRMSLPAVPIETFSGGIKLNDLFLSSEIVQSCNQYNPLLTALGQLLKGDPIIINSLNFLYGSQQPNHFDIWYMPPPIENNMAVASICLEDMTEENGPLTYYPRSHLIPAYRFSHGGIHAIQSEMSACMEYVNAELASRGLQMERFIGKRGDVFIWHAQLFHGGAPIANPKMTRRSLVTHFWRAQDLPAEAVSSTRAGLVLRREPHAA